MPDFHHRLKALRNTASLRVEKSVIKWECWNEVFGWVEMAVWFPVTRAVSPRGINVTILENINVS